MELDSFLVYDMSCSRFDLGIVERSAEKVDWDVVRGNDVRELQELVQMALSWEWNYHHHNWWWRRRRRRRLFHKAFLGVVCH